MPKRRTKTSTIAFVTSHCLSGLGVGTMVRIQGKQHFLSTWVRTPSNDTIKGVIDSAKVEPLYVRVIDILPGALARCVRPPLPQSEYRCVSISLNDIFENLSDPKISLPEIYLGQRVFLYKYIMGETLAGQPRQTLLERYLSEMYLRRDIFSYRNTPMSPTSHPRVHVYVKLIASANDLLAFPPITFFWGDDNFILSTPPTLTRTPSPS